MSDRNREIMQYARGEVAPRRQDRELAQAARTIYNEVQLARVEVDGVMVLAQHVMDRAMRLDAERRSLAQDDPLVNMMLLDIQATAMRQAKAIQSALFTGW